MRDRVKRFMTRLTFSISTLSYTVYLSSLRSCGVTAEFSMAELEEDRQTCKCETRFVGTRSHEMTK